MLRQSTFPSRTLWVGLQADSVKEYRNIQLAKFVTLQQDRQA